ncbi:MAG: selenoneine biosynthesis selenosugar synthase SenB [Usitatibacter sp.]
MVSSAKPVVCIVTPGTRSANNGNWRTAARWAGMLRSRYQIILQTQWDGAPADAMIALHAKRSADSVAAFRRARPDGPIAVILTGTDLYRDLPGNPEARRALDLAGRIVTLQEDALRMLETAWREKARVIFQSARPLARRRKAADRVHCVMVGHLRAEKDPATLFAAIARLPRELPITFRHIGAPLDPALGAAARELGARDPRYRYSGALPHGLARCAIAAAHLLVHPSRMEGGANVIVEAVTAGTPIIASRVSGNVGMLGEDYRGYFAAGDASGLAECLVEACREPGYLEALRAACARRKPLFDPRAEKKAVNALVAEMLP